MKKFNRNASIGLIILFILVTSYAAVDLLSLPVEILNEIGISENAKIKKAQDVAFSSYTVLVIDFFIVLLLVFMFSMNNVNHMAENIVYVERELNNQKSKIDDLETNFDLEAALHRINTVGNKGFENDKERRHELLSAICKEIDAVSGALYQTIEEGEKRCQKFATGYAFYLPDSGTISFEFGEGLVGQAAKSGNEIVINSDVPKGYVKVVSGLGESSPNNLIVLPIKTSEVVKGVLEIAGFKELNQIEIDFLRKASAYFLTTEPNEVEERELGYTS